ncbi:MAG: helix-turn-helix domain-containing protein [Rivihabitans pingtungensis]
MPGWLPAADSHFPGLSCIADSDGVQVAALGAQPGFAVAQVTLDGAQTLPRAGGIPTPPPVAGGPAAGYRLFALFEWWGAPLPPPARRPGATTELMHMNDINTGWAAANASACNSSTAFDTAWTLFEAEGYEAVTMERIAAEADVAKATLYKRTEALLRHRFHRDLRDGVRDQFPVVAAEPIGAARLRKFFALSAAWSERHRGYLLPYVRTGWPSGVARTTKPSAAAQAAFYR